MDLLAAVLDRLAQYEVASQPSLSEEAREAFKSRVAYTLSYELPQAYLDILSKTDGLDWNGVVLYASETRLQDDDELSVQGLLYSSRSEKRKKEVTFRHGMALV